MSTIAGTATGGYLGSWSLIAMGGGAVVGALLGVPLYLAATRGDARGEPVEPHDAAPGKAFTLYVDWTIRVLLLIVLTVWIIDRVRLEVALSRASEQPSVATPRR